MAINASPLEKAVQECVKETLKEVLGVTAARAIFRHMGDAFLTAAARPKVFSKALEGMLGSGGLVLERLILQRLYQKLGLEFQEKKGYAFSQYVRELEAVAKGDVVAR